MNPVLIALIAVFAAATIAPEASGATGDWADGARAKVRILSAGIGADGRLAAGLEIVMPPGWKTYWRNPGTAGVAPRFDFSASRNVSRADVAFPVPRRFDDGYSVINVYEDRVLLPVSVLLADPAKPVELTAVLDLGVCQTVCVPDRVEVRLTVPAGEVDAATDKLLAAARAALPGAPQPGVFAVESIARNGGTDGKPVFRLRATMPPGTEPEIFVEGPEDWAAYPPKASGSDGGQALYDVKFSRTGAKTPIEGAQFRVTISVGGSAIEQTVGLD